MNAIKPKPVVVMSIDGKEIPVRAIGYTETTTALQPGDSIKSGQLEMRCEFNLVGRSPVEFWDGITVESGRRILRVEAESFVAGIVGCSLRYLAWVSGDWRRVER